MSPSELNDYVKKHDIKMIDAKFVDFLGQWKHLTYPIERLEEGIEEGFGFDGSSVAGWRAINSSDMLMRPDPSTAVLDPFLKTPTLSILCDVVDPITHEPYARCPRSLAKRAVSYLKSTGLADTAYFGPEAEFFIFDSIQYSEEPNNSFFNIDSDEAGWNNKRTEGGGNKGF
ncbi:MAG TPA: glutamine synthetase beta-grasp domain-containing protein, partial [Kofleriaceae bacterium]|nr:glutamine synthetase beta-grasp domain-containing protein [Kofleriaceae bacterium]